MASSNTPSHGMFIDLYELTMVQSFLREGLHGPAVFELFFRTLPGRRNYLIAAGLEPALAGLETFSFQKRDLDDLREASPLSEDCLDYLARFRFSGDVNAVPEGTVVFPYEPLLQVIAPLPEAQLVETFLLNEIHLPTLAAGKAARIVTAAGGRGLVDFGARRAQGQEAARAVARAAWIAGFDGTSLVEAGRRFDIPLVGTMAHSLIQAHDDESQAFSAFLSSFPDSTLLVDTYDTIAGVEKVIKVARRAATEEEATARIAGIRLDSGDLLALSRQARAMLDEAGLSEGKIIASGGLDEFKIAQLVKANAPIDGFGVGTSLAVSDDAPSLDLAYKLVEYEGRGRMKLSTEKATYPGAKQVVRQWDQDRFQEDWIRPADGIHSGHALLRPVMRNGVRLETARLSEARQRAAAQLRALPKELRKLERAASPYPVRVAPALEEERRRLEQALRQAH